MQINQPSQLSLTPQLQLQKELNLREGQQIIARIVALSAKEALLEMAGRHLRAKIEGKPPFLAKGALLRFGVEQDKGGRILLRVQEELFDRHLEGEPSPETSTKQGKMPLSQRIAGSLIEQQLPVTKPSIAKLANFLREFGGKYQLEMEPEVVTFLMAQKLPLSSQTILVALLLLDNDLRESLWNRLKKQTKQSGATTSELLKNVLPLTANTDTIVAKLKSLTNWRYHQNEELLPHNSPVNPEMAQLKDLLEQNVAFFKEFNGDKESYHYNLIPLLTESGSGALQECYVHWYQEKNELNQAENKAEELIKITIPTDNMGSISLSLSLTKGVQLLFEVDSEAVKHYLQQKIEALKAVLDLAKVSVTFKADLPDNNDHKLSKGIDLWV